MLKNEFPIQILTILKEIDNMEDHDDNAFNTNEQHPVGHLVVTLSEEANQDQGEDRLEKPEVLEVGDTIHCCRFFVNYFSIFLKKIHMMNAIQWIVETM